MLSRRVHHPGHLMSGVRKGKRTPGFGRGGSGQRFWFTTCLPYTHFSYLPMFLFLISRRMFQCSLFECFVKPMEASWRRPCPISSSVHIKLNSQRAYAH